MKSKKYPREEEVEDVAYPEAEEAYPVEEVAVSMPDPSKVEDVEDKCEESSEILHSFVVKQLDEFVKLQVMTSTLEGRKYLVIPRQYFDTKPEEVVILDDSILVPFYNNFIE